MCVSPRYTAVTGSHRVAVKVASEHVQPITVSARSQPRCERGQSGATFESEAVHDDCC